MKRFILIISAAILAFGSFNASAAEKAEPKNNFKIYGFIRNYFTFDSRESVSGTGDLFYYIPKDVAMNAAGTEDLNAVSSFRFLALTSRLGVDVTGYSLGDVHFGAKIEGDFYAGLSSVDATKSPGSTVSSYFPSNSKIGGTATARLRQAYVTVTWKNLGEAKNSVALKLGQAWHPMAADMPHIFSLEAGAPFGPFSRTPQVTMDANLGSNWVLSASAIWQMQYQSAGPVGASPIYMKYGKTPEIYAGVTYKNGGFLARSGVDVLSIKPRFFGTETLESGAVNKFRVSDRKTSILGYVYAQYTYKNFGVKAKTTFGEGGEHMNLMSGYAKIGETADGSWEYASMRNSSSWLSLTYGKKWQGVLFLGYVKNLGLAEPAAAPIAKGDVYFCGNGFSNLNQVYRINPQLIYNIGKMNIGIEYQWTAVQYGDYNEGGKLDPYALAQNNLEWVGNNRINMMVKFNF